MSLTHEVVNRCLALIPLIREHQGLTLDELARLARLPKEQIADELGAVLLMCGVPPYFPHDYIGFYLDGDRVMIRFADQFRRPVSLSPLEVRTAVVRIGIVLGPTLEALALKLACESLAPPGKAIPKVVANLLSKVEGAMAPEQRAQFRNLARRVTVRETPELPGGITERVALAVAERRSLVLDYVAAGRTVPKARTVRPYGLISRDGHWYLVARDESRDRIVPFRLDRVRSVTALEERFEFPSDFRLEAWAQGSLVGDRGEAEMARIRFRGPSARWVRETTAAEALEEEGDNQVVWCAPIINVENLVRWVLGFGGDAEVLEPPSFRERVGESLRRVRAVHGA